MDLPAASLTSIVRYPVKGLPGHNLDEARLSLGQPLLGDRQYALRLPQSKLDPAAPGWAKKANFAQSARVPAMMANAMVEMADYSLPDDGARLASDVSVKTGIDGLVFYGGNGWLSDQQRPRISLLNKASVADLAERAGQTLEIERFRGNLIVDGWPAWAERVLVGAELSVGEVVFDVVDEIDRCAAPGTSPLSGQRDLSMLDVMGEKLGHVNCGLFLEVKKGGVIRPSDVVTGLS